MTDTPSAAPEVFDALKRVGIDITAACQVLQDETVSTFEASSRGTCSTRRSDSSTPRREDPRSARPRQDRWYQQ